MNLSVGIIGLPNVGKSTTFNALVQEQNAQVANYPFCTIEPNKAIVPIPDSRLENLAKIVGAKEIIPATIEFVDIAGLVEGASRGEGLGNKFLGNIRNVHAILHIVRCFADENVIHITNNLTPIKDIEIINTELVLADYEQLEKRIEKLERQVKGDKSFQDLLDIAIDVYNHLAAGYLIKDYDKLSEPSFIELNQDLQFLTAKPVIYLANTDEESLLTGNIYIEQLDEYSQMNNTMSLVICSKLEEDLIPLAPDEKSEYLELAGVKDTGLKKVIQKCYQILDLISFFTFNETETRAWTIKNGWKAPRAAGQIHTDFERGFIKAEVAPYSLFEQYGSWGNLREAGKSRVEGRDYIVQDGDVILFRFNV